MALFPRFRRYFRLGQGATPVTEDQPEAPLTGSFYGSLAELSKRKLVSFSEFVVNEVSQSNMNKLIRWWRTWVVLSLAGPNVNVRRV